MEHDPELGELLKGLRSEGEVDSSGSFSVDFLQAQRKLGHYQLSRPGEGLLKVIQACVASAASAVDLVNRGARLALRADARLPEDELQKLDTYLLHAHVHGPRGLHHLAVGLNALVAEKPRRLELRYGSWLWTPEQEWSRTADHLPRLELTLMRGERQEARWERLGDALRVPISQVPHYLRRAARSDLDEVAGRTAFCPVPVRLNRVLLNNPTLEALFAPRRQILQLGILTQGGPPAEMIAIPSDRRARLAEQIWAPSLHSLPAPRLKQDPPPRPVQLPGNDRKVVLAHGLLMFLSDPPGPEAALLFVQDGVTLSLKRADLGFPGVVAVLSAHGLKTDLSGFDLLEDEAYQELLARLRYQVRDLVYHVQGQLEGASWLDRATWGAPFLRPPR